MYRVITNTAKPNSDTIEFCIDVRFSLPTSIHASIDPILRKDKTIDEDALAEYNEFIKEAYKVIRSSGFKIIEHYKSSRSETSHYVNAYKKSESSAKNIKCLFFFRISDHDSPKRTEISRWKFHQHKAYELRQPTSKKRQAWVFKDIVVNNKEYDSYDEALKYLKESLN